MEVDSRPPWERNQVQTPAPNVIKKSSNPFKRLGLLNPFKKNKILPALLVGAILVAAGGGFFVFQNKNSVLGTATVNSTKTPKAIAEAVALIQKVGALTELPGDETPTIATVSDIGKLQNQAFFAKAQNGDKVLVYETSRKAILYRPSTNKIIEIAPISLPTKAATPSATIIPSVTLKPTNIPTQFLTPTITSTP